MQKNLVKKDVRLLLEEKSPRNERLDTEKRGRHQKETPVRVSYEPKK